MANLITPGHWSVRTRHSILYHEILDLNLDASSFLMGAREVNRCEGHLCQEKHYKTPHAIQCMHMYMCLCVHLR